MEAYFIIALICSGIGLVVAFISFIYNADENPSEPFSKHFRWASMIFSGGILIGFFWPLALALAGPVLLGYGVFSWARAIKHGTTDYD